MTDQEIRERDAMRSEIAVEKVRVAYWRARCDAYEVSAGATTHEVDAAWAHVTAMKAALRALGGEP